MNKILLSFAISMLTLTACAPAQEPGTLTVMTHDSFAISGEIVAQFEDEHGVEVIFLKIGDAGEATNRAVLTAGNPLADVFYGVDNTFLSRALEGDVFEPYESPLLEVIPDEFKLDPENRALPVDYGDVCLNYDKTYFEDLSVIPPSQLEDLLEPEYRGLLVVENPATSSPGLAFLLATIGHFGDVGYLEYWSGLVANDVKVVNDWETAYYTEFSRWGGARPIVVSYSSSPPVELIYAEDPMEQLVTAAVVANDSCFRQIEFVGILKGTQNRELAEAWVDFMLSPTFQEDMPLQMFVFPVNPEALLPPEFIDYLEIPESTAYVSPEDIAAHRSDWIAAWNETVLK